ncbi:DUF6350 family protein [Amycolatopsis cynarae]|uniref:DUF6350 family protein n=1 Tax=Amycolatopsis cynarae TaxID=2995223 RepID=A0ABY7B2E3_9PSEU|nr:DUF6350 family protein [Amycolatopsis sp. HUAS 11-8]WAL65056.1 DUF6350 family protein [Amycolatopsis sp. HUAS 11-8]
MQLLTSRSRPGAGAGDRRGGAGRAVERPTAAARTLLAAAVGPLLAGYSLVVALFALITVLAPAARFSIAGVLRAAGPGLLAAYQVPVAIGGRPLGVLPLLATAGMARLVAGSAAHAARRLGYRDPGQAVNVVAPMVVAHALFGVLVAIGMNGRAGTVEPLTAFLVPALVAGVGATAGLARQCGLAGVVREYLDPAALRGLRAGALGMAGLLAAGALVFAVTLAVSGGTARELFGTNAPGFGSGAGMLLLSLGYLPNAVIGALAFTVGTGFSLGSVSLTPFVFHGGALPGLPLLAGLPEHQARWWPMLMLLPAGVGALVGWYLRHSDGNPWARLRTVLIASTVVGFACVVLGTLAGGRLGSGSFGPVVIPAGLTSVAAFGWIAVPGALVAWLTGPRRRSVPTTWEDPGLEPGGEDGKEVLEELPEEPEFEPADESGEAGEPEDPAVVEAPPTSEEPEEPS